jgi:hypothetical protein
MPHAFLLGLSHHRGPDTCRAETVGRIVGNIATEISLVKVICIAFTLDKVRIYWEDNCLVNCSSFKTIIRISIKFVKKNVYGLI